MSIDERYSHELEAKVCVQQGSVFNPLLFIILLENLSHKFCFLVSWEDIYADNIVIIMTLFRIVSGDLIWNEAMEGKGLRV